MGLPVPPGLDKIQANIRGHLARKSAQKDPELHATKGAVSRARASFSAKEPAAPMTPAASGTALEASAASPKPASAPKPAESEPPAAVFYLVIAIYNVAEGVSAKVQASVAEKLPGARAAKAPQVLPKLAGLVASKLVAPEKVMGGMGGNLAQEMPAKLKEKMGLELAMEPVYVVGPLLVLRCSASSLELETLCSMLGEKNAKAAEVGGCAIALLKLFGIDESVSSRLKDVMLKPVLTKLASELPVKMKEKAGFEVEAAALTPSEFPEVFFSLTTALGVNGLPKPKKPAEPLV